MKVVRVARVDVMLTAVLVVVEVVIINNMLLVFSAFWSS